jgi:hypothetical protein
MSKKRQREESARALARLDKKQGIRRHGGRGSLGEAYRKEYYYGVSTPR